MKIYHTETQEDYDSLMLKLENEGAKWQSGKVMRSKNHWDIFREKTCVAVDDMIASVGSESTYREYRSDIPIKKYKAPSIKYKNDSVVLYPGRIFESDSVNSPKHHNSLKTEVIDTIEDVTEFYPKKIRYHIGNVIKYLFRAPFKNNIKEDLKKAQWYLQRAINKLED